MFWITLELSKPTVGLITRFSLLVKKLTAFKIDKKCAVWQRCQGLNRRTPDHYLMTLLGVVSLDLYYFRHY